MSNLFAFLQECQDVPYWLPSRRSTIMCPSSWHGCELHSDRDRGHRREKYRRRIRQEGGRAEAALVSVTGTNRNGSQWLRDSGTPRHLEPRQAPVTGTSGDGTPGSALAETRKRVCRTHGVATPRQRCKHKRWKRVSESRWVVSGTRPPSLSLVPLGFFSQRQVLAVSHTGAPSQELAFRYPLCTVRCTGSRDV